MPNQLQQLVSQYLSWQNQKEKAEEKLSGLKTQIITQAQKDRIKKIAFDQGQMLIVSQTETRFPQFDEPGRKEVEKIVKSSGELQQVMVFDIITLGNLYDQKQLSPALMSKLHPFAKKTKTNKIVIKNKT